MYIPTSQLDRNENINFDKSTCTSATTHTAPIIAERVLPVHNSPEENKKKKAIRECMRYAAKKKATKQPKAKKPNAKKPNAKKCKK